MNNVILSSDLIDYIDITAATGTYYLGLIESLGASNILAFWLD